MNKLLTVAMLLVLPYFLSAQDNPLWGKHKYIWDYTQIELETPHGLTNTFDLKAILSGADKISTIPTIDGRLIDYEFLKGKIVLIDFWFINCPPCRRELPALSELSKKYPGQEVVILSICKDGAADIIERGLDHSADNVLVVAGARAFLTNDMRFNYPFKALIHTDGNLIYSFLGGKRTATPVKDFVLDMSTKIDTLKTLAVMP